MIEYQLPAWLVRMGLSEKIALVAAPLLILAAVTLIAVAATWIVRRVVIRVIVHVLRSNRMRWDDALVDNHFFHRLSWFVPVLVFYLARDTLLPTDSKAAELLGRLISCGFVFVGVAAASSLLNTINTIHRTVRGRSGKTIRGYIDAIRIILLVLGLIFIIAILTDRSPWGLISLMGGLTAVVLLVFRDSILGFVAAVQLTGTDMVRVGDWIEMPAYDADGEVIEISIHAVRVRNWDKTITTIPTYALIAKSFRNWRGMSESGGRRIKRSLHLDMTSVRFLDDRELEELTRIELIRDYVREKQKEIDEDNRRRGVDTSLEINGRHQTNLGLFRAYVEAYLRQHPKIHQDMTFLVRQLQPTPEGLPLQVYVFSRDQVWARYEAIQADIFDHLIAALPWFGLRVFQRPTGHDLRQLGRPDSGDRAQILQS